MCKGRCGKMANDLKEFQSSVDTYLIRHRSVLDVLTKLQESSARVSRSFAKAVTECGCIEVHADKQVTGTSTTYEELKECMSSHIDRQLCKDCREVLSQEMGATLFYQAALCQLMGLDLEDILDGELKRIQTLGFFHLT